MTPHDYAILKGKWTIIYDDGGMHYLKGHYKTEKPYYYVQLVNGKDFFSSSVYAKLRWKFGN